jgi:hypothetical protein
MATIAVFLVLGGGAYAAFHLPKNSVRSRNIVNGQVRKADVSAGLTGSLTDHCPSGYTLAAHSNLCFEFDRRSPATFTDALKICAGNGGHLPSPGELAVAFDNLSPFQVGQWTTSTWFGNTGAAAVTMSQSSTRDITLDADLTTTPNNYRCVTSPSN